MTKTKAIRKQCLACAGNPKDVAFCTDPYCPLWEHRLGTDLRSTKGVEMMANNRQKYPKDFADLERYGVDSALYLPRTLHRIRPKLLNKGLQAFKSRQKDQPLPWVAGKPNSPSHTKNHNKNDDCCKSENGSTDKTCPESRECQESVDKDYITDSL